MFKQKNTAYKNSISKTHTHTHSESLYSISFLKTNTSFQTLMTVDTKLTSIENRFLQNLIIFWNLHEILRKSAMFRKICFKMV